MQVRPSGTAARLFYIIPVIVDSFGLQGEPRGADPMNLYYVKIAWGNFFWRVFLYVGLGSSLIFYFTASFMFQMKIKKQCAASGSDKKHDEKNYRSVGVGEANKRRRECHFSCGMAGFYLLWGVLDGGFDWRCIACFFLLSLISFCSRCICSARSRLM